MNKKINDYYILAQNTLSERRYTHSANVAKAAVRLAKKYGEDCEKAEIAGILHDITKELKYENQLQMVESGGIILDDVCKKSPQLLHAVTGMIYCRDVLGITDEDILNSIRYHTTARASMSLLEKILFIADFISDERDYPDVEIMRAECEKSLEDGMAYGLGFVIPDLVIRRRAIHPDALAAYNELVLNK
ncbi:MAG: bis(5'-nucleosyl)-tetraphosphatase (symmetrical) YqeK [Ruminococcus sp.]|nr:bis(5'-nucleosyl)-tetraphosphatase (symmetrical) YqeK [Ruminococcus sp.]